MQLEETWPKSLSIEQILNSVLVMSVKASTEHSLSQFLPYCLVCHRVEATFLLFRCFETPFEVTGQESEKLTI